MMDWLEKLAEKRRKRNPDFKKIEEKIENEDGGYEVDLVADASGQPLTPPATVAAGDSKVSYHL